MASTHAYTMKLASCRKRWQELKAMPGDMKFMKAMKAMKDRKARKKQEAAEEARKKNESEEEAWKRCVANDPSEDEDPNGSLGQARR